MTRLPAGLLILLLGSVPAWCGAETVYVIDKLLVGVHADKSLDSDIVKVLPTGTKLEVVERDGQVALVRDPEGVSGWVDTTYLMTDKPASILVDELEEKTRELQTNLANALAKAEELEANGTAADVAAADTPLELQELERRLSSARLKNGEMEAELRDVKALNREFQAELDALKAQPVAVEPIAQSTDPAPSVLSLGQLMAQGPVQIFLITALILMVMAFGGGLYLMDYLQRRRHGGYRI
jgi:SH3 domain protein